MAISKDLETRGSRKPILLKGTGYAICLEVKIGSLGLEIWHFPNEEAHPYARLIFESDQDLKRSLNDEPEEDKAKASVTLDWQQALAVSWAIQDWLSILESDIEDDRVPALHMEIASLTFDFYRQTVVRGPRVECAIHTETGLAGTTTLTRSEANLVGRLLYCLGDEEEDVEG